jgi:hypothetical protein
MEIYALDLDYDFCLHCAVPESFARIREERLSQELLEDDLARGVLDFQLAHYRKHGKPATGSVLEHEFEGLEVAEPQAAIDDLIDRLRERYARNEGRQAILNLAANHVSDPDALAGALLNEGRRLQRILTRRGETFTAEDYDKAVARYHKGVVAGAGPSMGFKQLDDYFYGQRGLTFLVGAPKSYKSWFTIKAVYENIMAGGRPFLYSLELPAAETDMRLRCLAAKVPYWKYLQNCLDPDDWTRLEQSARELEQLGNYFIEKPASGDRGVASLVQHARDSGADSIFIDQLQYVENNRNIAVGATNDTKDYFQVINDLRDLSDDGPIWVVHQFNRSIMNSDKMPEMQQIKGSAAVEECATLALGLWADSDMRKSHLVHLGTLTSRNYGYKTWEAQLRMRTTCAIDLKGEVVEDVENT